MEQSRLYKDIDLEQHMALLLESDLLESEYQVKPILNIQPGSDFITDLLERYLEDIRVREKEANFGEPSASTLLRKGVTLKEIDEIIENLQSKAVDLISNADKLSKKLAKEKALKEKQEIMKKLLKKKLEFPHKLAYKRQHSFKGRIHRYLVPPYDQEDFKMKMDNVADKRSDMLLPRSFSYEALRKNQLRPIQRER